MQVKAKKHLGQHFLTDLNIAKRISDALELETEMPVLEVGPGMGVLTQFLLQNEKYNTSVVEIDHESVEYLRIHYPQLNIIEGDFLRLKLEKLYDKPFCVIGNFPYNISSQIFFKVLEYRNQIPVCVGMIQKEVAERLAEPPGSKTYGILSVLLQAYYDIEYLFTVHEHVFNPPPKVKSAVIRMKRNNRTSLDCDERLFTTVVKTAFNQRRKQLRNSLKILIPKDSALFSLPIMDERPERLSVDQFIELTQQIANAK
ncbi:MAG: 16S rRNA (adenine(1518)-N(6)/adenine(1519)-N(6))-dimethyltransferase RsmA [Paludibacteraceae bacterium]|nr:16S rRNA (adenine(1518)-N(6)/adenine(1519)-N(6))-dimethyltransferase RsmA [Paludibacteraceae bacterium]